MKVIFLTPTYDGRADIGQRWPFASSLRHLEKVGHYAIGSVTTRGLLDHARNKAMAAAISSEADVAIWVDDDMVWKDPSLFTFLCHRLEVDPEAVLVAVNFPDQKGRPISLSSDKERLAPDYDGQAGFVSVGLAAARLSWYRAAWPTPMPPWFQIIPKLSEDGTLLSPLTEGFYHSVRLRERGAKVLTVPFETRNGDAEIGKPAPWTFRSNL